MSIRSTYITTTAFLLLAAASFVTAADDQHMHDNMKHGAMVSHLVENAKTAKDHQAIAGHFEEEAAGFDAKAATHERLAKQYKMGAGIGPKGNSSGLANHCNSLVKNLKASAADAREMARLHREFAKSIKP